MVGDRLLRERFYLCCKNDLLQSGIKQKAFYSQKSCNFNKQIVNLLNYACKILW